MDDLCKKGIIFILLVLFICTNFLSVISHTVSGIETDNNIILSENYSGIQTTIDYNKNRENLEYVNNTVNKTFLYSQSVNNSGKNEIE